MKKFTWREKLSYRFDNIMSKGTAALVVILFLITTLVVVIAGLLSAILDGEKGLAIFQSMWTSLMHAIDAGTLAGDEGNFSFILLMSIVTLCGLFITSMLIGIINSGLERKMSSLRKGRSRVLESNHVVILGFHENTYTILSELVEANENQKGAVVVVMDDCEKEMMEDAIRQRIPNPKTTRIICRSGQISEFASLSICSIATCRSIIINAEDDFLTIKAILASVSLLKQESAGCSAHITAVIQKEENLEAARIAGEEKLESLYFSRTIARIMAHTCRQPGISVVFSELFSYGGDEIYVERIKGITGYTFGEAQLYFPNSTVIGICQNGAPMVNPPSNMIIKETDSLILIAEDDGVSIPMKTPGAVNSSLVSYMTAAPEVPKQMLVLGCNSLLSEVLLEEDNYLPAGSIIRVAVPADLINRDLLPVQAAFQNLRLEILPCDIYDRSTLEDLILQKPENVLVISSDEDEDEEADAKILLLLLHLREIAGKTNINFTVTSEMRSTQNQELALVTRVNDFVVSGNITSLILTQISQTRALSAIFMDLLDADGSELYMKPAPAYVKLHVPVELYTAVDSTSRKNHVFLGYKKQLEDGNFEIVVNPEKSKIVVFSEKDSFIVIAED